MTHTSKADSNSLYHIGNMLIKCLSSSIVTTKNCDCAIKLHKDPKYQQVKEEETIKTSKLLLLPLFEFMTNITCKGFLNVPNRSLLLQRSNYLTTNDQPIVTETNGLFNFNKYQLHCDKYI